MASICTSQHALLDMRGPPPHLMAPWRVVEAAFSKVPDYPWSSVAILDPLEANRRELGIIYVNPALVPWTLCMVSSRVHEFWTRLHLPLSTLSRSTSRLACIRPRGERQMNAEREGITCFLSPALSALWQRPFGSSVIYFCSSSLQIWPPPKTRQLTLKHHVDAPGTFITFLPIKAEITELEADGVNFRVRCI